MKKVNIKEDIKQIETLSETVVVEDKTNSKWKYILSIVFMLGLFVITFALIAINYDLKEVFLLMHDAKIKWLWLGFLMFVLYIFFQGLSLKCILSQVTDSPCSLPKSFVYSSVLFYFSQITPAASGGQPMCAYYMNKDKISVSHSGSVLLTNTALYKIVLIICAAFALIYRPSYLFSHPLLIVIASISFLFTVGLIFLCFLGVFKRSIVEHVGRKIIMLLHKMNIVHQPYSAVRAFRHKMDEYEEGAKLIKKHKGHFTMALCCNLAQRIAMFSISYFVYRAFLSSYNLEIHSYFELLTIQIIVSLCVDSLPIPGGVGITEYICLILFGMIYTSDNMVASAMLITRGISFYLPLVVTSMIVIVNQMVGMHNKNKIKRS